MNTVDDVTMFDANQKMIDICLGCKGVLWEGEQELKEINKGSFGTVYDFPQHARYTKKVVVKTFRCGTKLEMFAREVNMVKLPRHNNIIQTFECVTLTTIQQVGLLLEKGGVELYSVLEATSLNDKRLNRFCSDILCGVKFLHTNGVIHCDLKPENILVCAHDTLKICDFGFAHHNAWPFGSLHQEDTYFGSEAYLPNASLLATPGFNRDEWAIGCIFFIMAYNHMLYTPETKTDVLSLILNRPCGFANLYGLTPRPMVERILPYLIQERPVSVHFAHTYFNLGGMNERSVTPRTAKRPRWVG